MPRKPKYSNPEEARLARNARDNATRKRRDAERAAKGLCPCGQEPVKPGCKHGEQCIARLSACSNRRYKKNKAANVCRICGKDSGGKAHCPEHRPKSSAGVKRMMDKRRAAGLCIWCKKPPKPALPGKDYCEEHRTKQRAAASKLQAKRRKIVLDHYGHSCYCCGQTGGAFLQIDHVNGGGNEHRRQIGQSKLYKFLIDNDFPADFRTACSDCNWSSRNGPCPHTLWPPELLAELRAFNVKIALTLREQADERV